MRPAPHSPYGEALRALLHQLNGGVHNAALALELAGIAAAPGHARVPRTDPGSAGRRGIEQAARASELMSSLLGTPAPRAGEDALPMLGDVADILAGIAGRRGVAFEFDRETGDASELRVDHVADALVAGIVAIQSATPPRTIRMGFGPPADGAQRSPLRFDVATPALGRS